MSREYYAQKSEDILEDNNSYIYIYMRDAHSVTAYVKDDFDFLRKLTTVVKDNFEMATEGAQ